MAAKRKKAVNPAAAVTKALAADLAKQVACVRKAKTKTEARRCLEKVEELARSGREMLEAIR